MALTKVSTAMFDTAAQSSDLNIDANTLFVDVSTNRVGIGTTSPSVPLEVSGQLKAGGILYPTSDGSNGQALVTDGSGTASFATVAPTAGTGVSVSGTTVSIGQAVGTSSNVTFNNLVVAGTLTVNGATNTNSATNTTIEDILIELGTGTSGSPANDAGLVLERGSSDNVFIGWDESADTFTVGTGSFTGASSGNLTITPATAVFGGLTVDTSTLVVDASNNRVGIGNASPDVSLDVGSFTDAVHVPVGTTAQRPTGAAGYFRYNSTLGKFEGYTDSWGEIGGGGSNTFTTNVYTGDGSTTAFTLSQSVSNVNNLIVFIDGVYQVPTAAYSVSGTTLTMTAAPANTRKIVAYSVQSAISGTNLNQNSFTGNGSAVAFTLSIAPVNENNTQVFLDGVYQHKSTYATSGTTLTFDTAPASGVAIEVMIFTQTEINVPVDGTITTAKLAADAVTSAKIADDAVGNDQLASGLTLGGNTTATIATAAQPNITSLGTLSALTISGDLTVDTSTLKVDSSNNRVGIGNTSPAQSLHVGSSSSGTSSNGIRIEQNEGAFDLRVDAGEFYLYDVTDARIPFLINTSGNVGIGETTPFSKFHVKDTGWSSGSPYGTVQLIEGKFVNDQNWGHLVITDEETGSGQGGSLRFATGPDSSLNPFAGIQGSAEGTSYGGLAFYTRPSGGTATERMVIDSTGIVTITPDTGATTGTLRLHNGNGNGTLGQIDFGHSGSVHHGSILYTGNMDFHTGGSADSRFFISSTGNVGINTSNPEHHLHVTEPGSTREDGIVKIGGSTTALGLELKYDQAGATTTEIVANPTYTNTSSLMRLCVDRDANANQLCLLGSGNIGIGSDAPGTNKLYVISNTDAIFTAYFLNDHAGGYGVAIRSDSSSMMYFYDGGTFKGRIYHNGTTMLYADQSDYRLKENIQTMTGSIDRIKKLNPVTFDWKADGKSSEGFLAHEVQDVVPTAVAGEKDAEITEHGEGIQIMDYGKVTPVLVGALQEALAKIEILETKVAALENK